MKPLPSIKSMKKELKQQRKFDPKTDYMFYARNFQSVTVYNRPYKKYNFYAYNSPALDKPLQNKYFSYYVTNQVLTRTILIAMSVASVFIFSSIMNEIQFTELINGPIFAFAMLVKYLSQLLLTQYVGPPAYDRVFRSIEQVFKLCYYSSAFASTLILLTNQDFYRNVSFAVYAISAVFGIALCIAPKLPYWVHFCVYISFLVCAIITLAFIKSNQIAMTAIVLTFQTIGGIFTCFKGINDGENFKKKDEIPNVAQNNEGLVSSQKDQIIQVDENETKKNKKLNIKIIDKLEKWWISTKYIKEYIGPYDIHFLAIAIADLCYSANLRSAVSNAAQNKK